MEPHQLPIGRYIRLRGGYRVSKEDNWQESLDVKNSMYRVEPAQHESHCLDCPANPNRWVCSACVSWAQNGICKHVLAVTHVLEAEKPAEEQDHRLNLKRLLLALPRVKDKKGKGRARGGGAGYRMITGALQPQLGVGKSVGRRGRAQGTQDGRRAGDGAANRVSRRGGRGRGRGRAGSRTRGEESSATDSDDEDLGDTGQVSFDWQVDHYHATCYRIPLNTIPDGAILACRQSQIRNPTCTPCLAILCPRQHCAQQSCGLPPRSSTQSRSKQSCLPSNPGPPQSHVHALPSNPESSATPCPAILPTTIPADNPIPLKAIPPAKQSHATQSHGHRASGNPVSSATLCPAIPPTTA